jgi:hypothetical protein
MYFKEVAMNIARHDRELALSSDRLRQVLTYNPVTGIFRHRRAGRSGVTAESVAGGTRRDRYISLLIDGNRLYAHRLAWFWIHGQWPANGIDHIDGNPSNNAIANLREATQSQIVASGKPRANQTGFRNVYRHQGRYRVQIVKQGRAHSFGVFDALEEAAQAAAYWRDKLYGEFAD